MGVVVGVGARIGHAQGAPRLLSLLRGPLLLLPPVLVVLLLLLEQLLLLLLEGASEKPDLLTVTKAESR